MASTPDFQSGDASSILVICFYRKEKIWNEYEYAVYLKFMRRQHSRFRAVVL